jgi:hypothetical protein
MWIIEIGYEWGRLDLRSKGYRHQKTSPITDF